jgi:hypothetical protein
MDMTITSTKIRAGLYEVTANDTTYWIMDTEVDSGVWMWRVSDQGRFHDGWMGDYATKREALEMLETVK